MSPFEFYFYFALLSYSAITLFNASSQLFYMVSLDRLTA